MHISQGEYQQRQARQYQHTEEGGRQGGAHLGGNRLHHHTPHTGHKPPQGHGQGQDSPQGEDIGEGGKPGQAVGLGGELR